MTGDGCTHRSSVNVHPSLNPCCIFTHFMQAGK